MLKLYFDGGCLPKNPGGIATYGFIVTSHEGAKIGDGYGIVGSGKGMTNNVAEYTGLIQGLRYVKAQMPDTDVLTVYGDSELVINMAAKRWGKKGPHKNKLHLKVLLEEVWDLIVGFDRVHFIWIPRRENYGADSLTRIAFKDYRAKKITVGVEKHTDVVVTDEKVITLIKSYLADGLDISDIKHTKPRDMEMLPYDMIQFKYKGRGYELKIREMRKNALDM